MMAVWDEDEVRHLHKVITGADLDDVLTISALARCRPAEACKLILQFHQSAKVCRGKTHDSPALWDAKPSIDDVRTVFSIILQRDTSETDLEQAVASTSSIRSLLTNAASSLEAKQRIVMNTLLHELPNSDKSRRNTQCDVLLFGAFGNGNLGDHDQANAVAELLTAAGISKDRIGACSWEQVAPFAFSNRRYGWHAIIDLDLLASFKLLVIGGGGLLGAPHFPLYDERWIDGLIDLGIPYALCAIGAEIGQVLDTSFSVAYKKLISHAAFVSGRDLPSVAALNAVRSDVVFLPDILLLSAMRRTGSQASVPKQAASRRRIDVILRPPQSKSDRSFLDGFREIYHDSSRDDIGAIFIEPGLSEEKAIMAEFPGASVYRSIDQLAAALSRTAWGASMRLHGAVAFFQAQVPFVGFCQPKIQQTMALLGIEDQYSSTPEQDLLDRIRRRDGSGLIVGAANEQFARRAEDGAGRFVEFVRTALR